MGDYKCIEHLLFNDTLPTPNMTSHIIIMTSHIRDLGTRNKWTGEQVTLFKESLPCMRTLATSMKGENVEHVMSRMQHECLSWACDLCIENSNMDSLIFCLLNVVSLFVMLCASCCVKRKSCLKSVCGGRPGPLVPLNMLDNYTNRIGLAVTFGVVVHYCYYVLFADYDRLFFTYGSNLLRRLPSCLAVLVKLACCVLISHVAYPCFVFQTTRNKFVGSLCGFFYVGMWFATEMFKISYQSANCRKAVVVDSLVNLPSYVCLLLLLIKFVYVLIITTLGKLKRLKEGQVIGWLLADDTDWRKQFVYLHVKRLLQVPKKNNNTTINLGAIQDSFLRRTWMKIRSKLYKSNPEFKYSTRILSSCAVCLYIIYIISCTIIIYGSIIFSRQNYESIIGIFHILAHKWSLRLDEVQIRSYIDAAKTSWYLGAILAIVCTGKRSKIPNLSKSSIKESVKGV